MNISFSPRHPPIKLVDDPLHSCDSCGAQEGRHYCLLHGITLKNMDMIRCDDWEMREGEKEKD